ncbi:chromosome partition protein [Escherichia coli]|uniref:Chromosome partition protein n=1 Tax=Escherichia coli TaxID=562 RepID=A0A377CXQ2_ECOLX|nr:chromosome partition protein [Escherichia coli]
MSVQPTQLVTETLSERQARVLPLKRAERQARGDGRRAV